MTKEDFLEWRQHPVTLRVFEEIQSLINLGTDELSQSAGIDSANDRLKVGRLDGFRTVVGISFYELEDERVN